MRAIARSAALVFIAASFACADAHDDVIEVFTRMAAALTGFNGNRAGGRPGNVAEFMANVSRDMPEYDTLKNNVTALVSSSEVSSSIEPVNESVTGQSYQIDLDWFLEARSLAQDGPVVRRREVIHCQLRKEKSQWKIVALKPLDFFAPADLGK